MLVGFTATNDVLAEVANHWAAEAWDWVKLTRFASRLTVGQPRLCEVHKSIGEMKHEFIGDKGTWGRNNYCAWYRQGMSKKSIVDTHLCHEYADVLDPVHLDEEGAPVRGPTQSLIAVPSTV